MSWPAPARASLLALPPALSIRALLLLLLLLEPAAARGFAAGRNIFVVNCRRRGADAVGLARRRDRVLAQQAVLVPDPLDETGGVLAELVRAHGFPGASAEFRRLGRPPRGSNGAAPRGAPAVCGEVTVAVAPATVGSPCTGSCRIRRPRPRPARAPLPNEVGGAPPKRLGAAPDGAPDALDGARGGSHSLLLATFFAASSTLGSGPRPPRGRRCTGAAC